MPSIDNRVVSISFDNVAFQKNVSDTIASLDGLKAKLNFGESTAGFSDLTKASQAVNLSSISGAVDNISSKFSAMGAIAFTALQNITNRAIEAGTAFSKSFTFAPVTQGFAEYELKIGAIQTIMAGTGETLDVVNGKLQELNDYSDQTIYSFADMTQNIGKFTNAGVSLEDSVAAIKGIANVAAISGANAEEASRSMYNFGQAMSAGTIRNIDWKSIELANMATVGFKDEIIKTAVELGTLTKTANGYETANGTAVTSTKNFTQSLEEEWFTADVLTKTLNRYSDATTDIGAKAEKAATEVKTFSQLMGTVKEAIGSGWSSSFEIVIGTFDEAKEELTKLNDAIGGFVGKSAEARNELLSKWKALGGRTILIEGLKDAFKSLGTIFKPIQEAFREVFPKKTAEDLLALTKLFAAFTKRLAIGGNTAAVLKGIFKGFFMIFKVGFEIIKGVFTLFSSLVGLLSTLGGGALNGFFKPITDGIASLGEKSVDASKIANFFNSIFEAVKNLVTKINLAPVIGGLIKFRDAILGLFGGGSSGGASVQEGAKETTSLFDKLANVLGKLGDFGVKIARTVEKIFNGLSSFAKSVSGGIKDIWEGLGDALSSENFDKVLKGAGIGLFGGILLLIKGFFNNGLAGLLAGSNVMQATTKLFGELGGTLQAFSTNLKADALLKLAIAIAVLAGSILLLSFVDPTKIGFGLVALGAGVAILTVAMKQLSQMALGPGGVAQIVALSVGLGILSGAILILAIAAFVLGRSNLADVALGLGAVIVFIGLLSISVKYLDGMGRELLSLGVTIGLIAISMLLLAAAVKAFSYIKPEEMVNGLRAMGVLLFGLALAMRVFPEHLEMVKLGAGLILIALSMYLFAGAIKILSNFDYWDLGKGIGAMGASLAVLFGTLNLMPEDDIMRLSFALIAVGIAMNLITRAVEGMAAIDFWDVAKSIVAFGVTFALLGLALKTVEKSGPAGALALIGITYGLGQLTKVFQSMESISWGTIIKGLLTFGLLFAGLAIAAAIAQYLAVGLIVLGGTIFAIGAGFALAGAGVYLLAEGFMLLAKAGEAGLQFLMKNIDDLLSLVPKISYALGQALFMFVAGFITGIPELINTLLPVLESIIDMGIKLMPKLKILLISAFDTIVTVITESGPKLLAAGYAFLLNFIEGFAENISEFTESVVDIVTNFLTTLSEKAPELRTAGIEFLRTYLTGLTEGIKELAPVVVALIVAFIGEIGKAYVEIIKAGTELIVNLIVGIGNAAGDIVTAGFNTLMSFIQGVADNIQEAIDQGFEIVIEFLNGVANSIRENRRLLAAAGFNLLDAIFGGVLERVVGVASWFGGLIGSIIGWIGDALGALATTGYQFISGMFAGIIDRLTGVITWFNNLGTTIVGWIGDATGFLVGVGRDIVRGIWDGILEMRDWLMNRIEDMVDWMPGWARRFLGIESPSKVFAEIGTQIGAGLGVGMDSMHGEIERASYRLSSSVVDNFNPDEKSMTDTITRMITAVISKMENMDEFNPTITPVLDLTGVNNDAKALKSIFGSSPMSTDFAYNQARVISNAESDRVNSEAAGAGTTEVNFNQTINAPTPLSTNDIYRQTRSQIALAKKELSLV